LDKTGWKSGNPGRVSVRFCAEDGEVAEAIACVHCFAHDIFSILQNSIFCATIS